MTRFTGVCVCVYAKSNKQFSWCVFAWFVCSGIWWSQFDRQRVYGLVVALCVSQSNRCCVCAQWMLWRGRFLWTRALTIHFSVSRLSMPMHILRTDGSLTPHLSENNNNNKVKWMRVSFAFNFTDTQMNEAHTCMTFSFVLIVDTFVCVTMQHFKFYCHITHSVRMKDVHSLFTK